MCALSGQSSSHHGVILQLHTGGPETEQEINDVEGNCNNVDDEEEECWMRRTLAAHVDYIYTQKHNQP